MEILKKIVYWFLLIVVVLVALFVIFTAIPIPGNLRMYVVQSGSMEPEIKTGSLIIIKPESEYQIGEIITFNPVGAEKKSQVVTHRIAGFIAEDGETKIITKGDANENPDFANTPPSRIIGKMTIGIPYLGYPIGFAKTLPGLIILIVIPGTIIIYGEIQNIIREIKKRKKKNVKKLA